MTPTNPTDAQIKLADVTDEIKSQYAIAIADIDKNFGALSAATTATARLILAHMLGQAAAIQATEARAQGLVEAERERCARIVERRAEARFAENGTREWDTNATYYQGGMAEIYEALDEEADEIAAAIRHSQHGGERER